MDSEENFDFLTVQVDDNELLRLSGNVAWNRRVLEIQPGVHRVRFIYSKDTSLSTAADAAWVDEVSFTPGPVPPPVRITGIRFSPNGLDILADFNSRTGRNYTIERSSDLAFWTAFAGTLSGNGNLMSFTHSNGRTGNPRWFYRVREITP